MACAAKYVVGLYLLAAVIQLALSITLIVYGTKGLDVLDKEGSRSGIPYPVGALLVGSVYIVVGVSNIAMVALWLLNSESVAYVSCCFCVFVYLGLPSFILGLIFVTAFGLANCKTEGLSYDEKTGFCSYEQNIDENYNIATVCLVLIILLFVTVVIDIFMLCKYGDLEDDTDYGDGTVVGTGGVVGPTGSSSVPSQGGNPTLKKMRIDRERRNDEQRQRRLGVPEHRITRKFIGKFGF